MAKKQSRSYGDQKKTTNNGPKGSVINFFSKHVLLMSYEMNTSLMIREKLLKKD